MPQLSSVTFDFDCYIIVTYRFTNADYSNVSFLHLSCAQPKDFCNAH